MRKAGASTIVFIIFTILIAFLILNLIYKSDSYVFSAYQKLPSRSKETTLLFILKDPEIVIYPENIIKVSLYITPLVGNLPLDTWILEFRDYNNDRSVYCRVLGFTENPYESRYIKIIVNSSRGQSTNDDKKFDYILEGDVASVVIVFNKTCTSVKNYINFNNKLRFTITIGGIPRSVWVTCKNNTLTNIVVCREG